jgi:hypothetical protein
MRKDGGKPCLHRDRGLGFRVSSFGFRVGAPNSERSCGCGLEAIRCLDFGFRVKRTRDLGFRVKRSGLRLQALE